MKLKFSDTFAEQVGADSLDEFSDRIFGKVGTRQRYLADREMLKLHIRDTFVTYLFYPLRWLPWGHIAETWWFYFFTERFYSALDGMAFMYVNDCYVIGLRDALDGQHHNYPVKFSPELRKPFWKPMKFPVWLLTNLVWPQFYNVWAQRREIYK
jgi:hypothetical protein